MKLHSPQPAVRRLRQTFPYLLGLLLAAALAADLHGAEVASVPGITEPFLDVTLSASVPGIVTARKFKEGDFIQEGQVLLELDKRLEELEVDRRRLVRDQKKNDYEGTRKLFSSTRGVSKEDLEKKEVEYRVAAVEHEMAEEQLRRRKVISPLSGTITEIMLEVGESCTAYQALIRVIDTRRGYFITNVEARHAARLKTGQTLKLEIETGASPINIQAQITLLSPVVDRASGLRRVELLFDNADGRVVPGVAGKLIME